MSPRSAVAALVLTCVALTLGVDPAGAVREGQAVVSSSPTAQDVLQASAERQVRERELALTAMFDAAERYAQVEGVQADRLAALGYTGDLPALDYVLPIQDYDLSAGFGQSGPLWESIHTGLDFGAPTGTDLVALADGTITEVAYAGPYGIRTILTLEDGTEIWYCHQLTPLVYQGQTIEIGEPIGLVGSTGNTTGPHLHLEVRPGSGAPVDPAAWLFGHGLGT